MKNDWSLLLITDCHWKIHDMIDFLPKSGIRERQLTNLTPQIIWLTNFHDYIHPVGWLITSITTARHFDIWLKCNASVIRGQRLLQVWTSRCTAGMTLTSNPTPAIYLMCVWLTAQVYLFKGAVNLVKSLGTFWKLRTNVSAQKYTFQIHPLTLDQHPCLQIQSAYHIVISNWMEPNNDLNPWRH